MLHRVKSVKYLLSLIVIGIAVLQRTYAVQFSNFFEIHLQAYNSVNPSVIVGVINKSQIIDRDVRLEKGMITYESDEKFVRSRSPANTVGDLMAMMFDDMKIHLIRELDRYSNIHKSAETNTSNCHKSTINDIKHILPGCHYIPTLLNYVYNNDVEFENLLSAYYAQCVFKDTWCKFHLKRRIKATTIDNLKKHLIKILQINDTPAPTFDISDSKESLKINNWNNFLKEMHKILQTSDKLWVKPEWLTLRFILQNNKAPLHSLLNSQVYLNDLYWGKPIIKMRLTAIYKTLISKEADSKILLIFYNIVLQKIDWVINRYLYHHFFIIYSNMASSESSAVIYDHLKPLMRNCDWKKIIWSYEKIMPLYKKNYVDIYKRQEIMAFMKDENSWTMDFIKSRKIFLDKKVLISHQLRMISKYITVDWPTDKSLMTNDFAYDYDRTNKWITENCNQAVEFVNELYNITAEHVNVKSFHFTNSLKNYRSKEISKDASMESLDDSSIFTQQYWSKMNLLSLKKRKQPGNN